MPIVLEGFTFDGPFAAGEVRAEAGICVVLGKDVEEECMVIDVVNARRYQRPLVYRQHVSEPRLESGLVANLAYAVAPIGGVDVVAHVRPAAGACVRQTTDGAQRCRRDHPQLASHQRHGGLARPG